MNKNLMKAYEKDASGLSGKAKDVFIPKNMEEVLKIVMKNERIVPRGAGTGFSGGAIPQNGEDVVLDLSKLNKISNLDLDRMTVEVEAGVVLADLNEYLENSNLVFPVSPASREVCTIGGMIATNASDSRVGMFGRVSSWIKWIDVINSEGTLERKGATEITDYIGMEGTTGVIVGACLKLIHIRKRTASVIKVEHLDEVVSIVRHFKRDANVSMIEFFDSYISKGIGLGEGYHLIVEYENDSGKIFGEEYLKLIGLVDEVYLYMQKEGYLHVEDPKILVDRFIPLMEWLTEKKIPVSGSLGSGNLNCFFNSELESEIPEMMNRVTRHGGVISGRFGIGILKKDYVDLNDKKILLNIKRRCDLIDKFNMGKMI